MIKDGLKRTPAVPYSLRRQGWQDMSTITLMHPNWEIGGLAYAQMVEVITSEGIRVRAFYAAEGDYKDRWMSATLQDITPVYWRPLSK